MRLVSPSSKMMYKRNQISPNLLVLIVCIFTVNYVNGADCSHGTYRLNGTCVGCPAGQFNPAVEQTQCWNCMEGRVSNGSAYECETCPAGKFAEGEGSSTCLECRAGKFSADGASYCMRCTAGYFEKNNGSSWCDLCENNFFSDEGSTYCDQAIDGYFAIEIGEEEFTVDECPKDSICTGGYLLPIPRKGFWVDRSEPSYLGFPYECPRNTCGGNRSSSFCWTQDGIENKDCDQDNLLCSEGATGPLCGSCMKGYAYSSSELTCLKCTSSSLLSLSVFILIGVLGVVLMVILFQNGAIYIPDRVLKSELFLTLSNISNGTLKIVFSTYQIVQSVAYSMDIEYPSPFSSYLNGISLLSLDLTGFECTGFNSYQKVVIFSAVPVVLGIIFFLYIEFRLLLLKCVHFRSNNKQISKNQGDSGSTETGVALMSSKFSESKQEQESLSLDNDSSSYHTSSFENEQEQFAQDCASLRSIRMYGLLLLSYLVLPPVSLFQLRFFDCISLHATDQSRYLRVDTSINCDSKSYKTFLLVDGLMIFIYISIPFIWMIVLYMKRHRLFPAGVQDDTSILIIRRNDQSLSPIMFLFDCYRPQMIYWEAVEMFRRITFISVIPLLAASTLRRGAIGLILSVIAMIVYREAFPFIDDSTNSLAYLAQIVIFLTFAGSLILETEISNNLNPFLLGLILLSVNLAVIVTAFASAYLRSQKEKRELKIRLDKQLKKIEWAHGFSANKFTTTFDTVIENSVPPSHCLAFFFSSLSDIEQILKSGIPVHKIPGNDHGDGIIFTLHHPHSLTDEEKKIFKNREAFVACSLPRHFLIPLIDTQFLNHEENVANEDEKEFGGGIAATGENGLASNEYSTKSSLFLLQSKILIAMRGTYFNELADSQPWYDGLLMMPPHAIKRAYQLMTNEEIKENEAKLYGGEKGKGGRKSRSNTKVRYSETQGVFQLSETENQKRKLRHSSRLSSLALKPKEAPMLLEKDEKGVPHAAKDKVVLVDTKQLQNIHSRKKNKKGLNQVVPFKPASCVAFLDKMREIRIKCKAEGLVPLYHYTMPVMAPLIINGGLRMSTQGQGDGGVYFSTLGPASYNIGSPQYEENIIVDCFGKERLEEYRGKHKLDLCFVYAIEPWVVEQAPGGRENAKVVGKTIFEEFSLPHADGNFFLRADKLVGAFILDPAEPLLDYQTAKDRIYEEQKEDLKVKEQLEQIEQIKEKNEVLVKTVTQVYDHIVKIEWACNYSAAKFSSTLSEMEESLKLENHNTDSHVLAYYYSTHVNIDQILRSGIPIDTAVSLEGIILTLNKPDDLTREEKLVFKHREAFVACALPKRLLHRWSDNNRQAFIEKNTNTMSSSDSRSNLRLLSSRVLIALRGNFFNELSDAVPWHEGYVCLSPHCIKRAFQLIPDEEVLPDDTSRLLMTSSSSNTNVAVSSNDPKSFTRSTSLLPASFQGYFNLNRVHEYKIPIDNNLKEDNNNDDISQTETSMSLDSDEVLEYVSAVEFGMKLEKSSEPPTYVVQPKSIEDYLSRMQKIRARCKSLGLVPMYHYTLPQVSSTIIKDGFKLKFHGKKEDAIYFNTCGPLSYGLGKAGPGSMSQYEKNVAKDLLGLDENDSRLSEFTQKHQYDLVLVYGVEPLLIESINHKKDNFKQVSRSTFRDFSLPQQDGCHYLRPDLLMGAFIFDLEQASKYEREKVTKKVSKSSMEGSMLDESIEANEEEEEVEDELSEKIKAEIDQDAKVLSKISSIISQEHDASNKEEENGNNKFSEEVEEGGDKSLDDNSTLKELKETSESVKLEKEDTPSDGDPLLAAAADDDNDNDSKTSKNANAKKAKVKTLLATKKTSASFRQPMMGANGKFNKPAVAAKPRLSNKKEFENVGSHI